MLSLIWCENEAEKLCMIVILHIKTAKFDRSSCNILRPKVCGSSDDLHRLLGLILKVSAPVKPLLTKKRSGSPRVDKNGGGIDWIRRT